MTTEASAIMADPLLNFQDVGRSMDTWHFLFDPTGSQAGAASAGLQELRRCKSGVYIFSWRK